MYHIFLCLIFTLLITTEAQTCTSDFSCPSTLYCPIYPGTSPPITRTCRSPQSSTSTSYCNKNPTTSSPDNHPQCRGWCDVQTNTCKDGVDIGGICITNIPRTCSRGYCQSTSGGIGTCQYYRALGETCTENIQCSSNYCVNNGGAAKTCQSGVDDAIRNAATAFAIGYIIAIIISSICAISICIGICICICRASRRPVIINNNAHPKLMVASVTYPQQQQQPTSMPLQPMYAPQQQQQQPYAPQQQSYAPQQQQPYAPQQQQPYGTPQPIQGQPMIYSHTPQQQQPMYLPQGQPMYAPGIYPQGQPMPMYGTTPQQPVQMYAPNQPVASGSQPYVAPPAYAPSSDAFPQVNKPDVEARPVSSSPSAYQPLIDSSNNNNNNITSQ